jgi:BolA family transcriptional regulator, general stress-responsive regulator
LNPAAPSTTSDRVQRIRERLETGLQPSQLDIFDDSHLHAGHAGARDGRGHFRVRVVAERFAGLPTVRRHRLVYDCVAEMMQTDIHALSITALTPEQARSESQ